MSVVELDAEFIIGSIVDQFRPLFKYIKSNGDERVDEGILIEVKLSLSGSVKNGAKLKE